MLGGINRQRRKSRKNQHDWGGLSDYLKSKVTQEGGAGGFVGIRMGFEISDGGMSQTSTAPGFGDENHNETFRGGKR